jgi:hypothetical protein
MNTPYIGDADTCAPKSASYYGHAELIILWNDPDDQGRCEKVNIGMGFRPPEHKLKCHDISHTQIKAQVDQADNVSTESWRLALRRYRFFELPLSLEGIDPGRSGSLGLNLSYKTLLFLQSAETPYLFF